MISNMIDAIKKIISENDEMRWLFWDRIFNWVWKPTEQSYIVINKWWYESTWSLVAKNVVNYFDIDLDIYIVEKSYNRGQYIRELLKQKLNKLFWETDIDRWNMYFVWYEDELFIEDLCMWNMPIRYRWQNCFTLNI